MAGAERRPLPPRLGAALPLLGLVAVVFWLLHATLFGGRAFYERDVHLQWYGQVEALVGALAGGAWPTWDPNLGFGMPLLANPNNQVLYPTTLLHLVLHPPAAYTVYVLLHLVFGASGVLLLARRLGSSRSAGFLAATVWVACGPFLSLINAWNHLAGAAALPWTLLAAEVALSSLEVRHAWRWGAALALPILAGSPDMAAIAWGVCLVPVLRRVRTRPSWRVWACCGVAVVTALGLSAGQWLPTLAGLHETGRANLAAADRTYWSIHPLNLVQVVFPVPLAELPLAPSLRALLFESREPFLRSLYLGLPASLLVVAAFLGPPRPYRWPCAGGGVVATLLALGSHAPVLGPLTAALPLLAVLRFPTKFFVLAALCWALLAGMGLDAWPSLGPRARRLVGAAAAGLCLVAAGGAFAASFRAAALGASFLFRTPTGPSYDEILAPTVVSLAAAAGLGAAAALALVFGPATSLRARSLIVGAAALDLVLRHAALNPTAPPSLYTFRPPALQAIRADGGRRLFVYDYNARPDLSRLRLGRDVAYRVPLAHYDPGQRWLEALAVRAYLLPPLGAAWGLRGSYEADRLHLQPTPLVALDERLWAAEGTPAFARLLRVGGVTHVVALHEEGLDGLPPVAALPGLFAEPIRVFRLPDALPDVWVVGRARLADGASALEALVDPAFDPAHEVVLPAGTPTTTTTGAHGNARVVERRPDRLVIEADVSGDGWVVMPEGYDPGWRATVDGVACDVLRANVAFRAVHVVGGHHVVELRYRPRGAWPGLAVSAVALLSGVFFGASGVARRRPRPDGPGEPRG